MRKLLSLALVLALAVILPVAAFAEGSLVVYTPNPDEEITYILNTFAEKYDVDIELQSMGTGVCYTRLDSEKANPQADVMFGGVETTWTHDYPDLFETYVANGNDKLPAEYQNPDGLITYYILGGSCVMIVNDELEAELGIEIKSYADLLNPALKGKIAFASPAKSGSAYTQLCTMLFSKDTIDEGWELVFNFIKNLDGKVQDSSGNCHKLVASGEYAVGVTIEKSAVLYNDNPDIAYVYPEKNSAVPDGVALIKNCPNPDNAKLFIDFVTGLECQTAQNADWARRPVRADLTPVGLVGLDTLDLGNYDFAYAAKNKAEIVEKWNDLTIEAEE